MSPDPRYANMTCGYPGTAGDPCPLLVGHPGRCDDPASIDEITDAVIAEVWPDRVPVVWREDVRRAVELTLELSASDRTPRP